MSNAEHANSGPGDESMTVEDALFVSSSSCSTDDYKESSSDASIRDVPPWTDAQELHQIAQQPQPPDYRGLHEEETKEENTRIATMASLPALAGVPPLSDTLSILRHAAETWWPQWSVGSRTFWLINFDYLFHHAPKLSFVDFHWHTLIQGTPHIMVRMLLRYFFGKEVENNSWWIHREGLAKATLDAVVPLQEGFFHQAMRKEGIVYRADSVGFVRLEPSTHVAGDVGQVPVPQQHNIPAQPVTQVGGHSDWHHNVIAQPATQIAGHVGHVPGPQHHGAPTQPAPQVAGHNGQIPGAQQHGFAAQPAFQVAGHGGQPPVPLQYNAAAQSIPYGAFDDGRTHENFVRALGRAKEVAHFYATDERADHYAAQANPSRPLTLGDRCHFRNLLIEWLTADPRLDSRFAAVLQSGNHQRQMAELARKYPDLVPEFNFRLAVNFELYQIMA